MALLNREDLLKKDDLKVEKVDLGEDEYIYVRCMTGHERDKFEQSLMKEKTDSRGNIKGFDRAMEDFRAKLAVLTICDEKGELLLRHNDYVALSRNMRIDKLEKIIEASQKLNKITDQDKEEMVKNSDAGLEDNSSSGSVENLE
jgi:hypothetical protein